MPTQHQTILMQANAAIDRGDIEGFLSHCTDDLSWTAVGDRTLHGKQAVRQWMAGAYRNPPRYTVDRWIVEGDLLTVLGHIWPQGEDGRARRHAYCDVWRFRGDKMAELQAFVIQIADDGSP